MLWSQVFLGGTPSLRRQGSRSIRGSRGKVGSGRRQQAAASLSSCSSSTTTTQIITARTSIQQHYMPSAATAAATLVAVTTTTAAAVAICEEKPSVLRKRVTLHQANHYNHHPPGAPDNSQKEKTTTTTLQRSSTQQELSKLQRLKSQLFQQWERDEDGWRQLPARAWPEDQPDGDQLDRLEKAVADNECQEIIACTKCKKESASADVKCQELLFQLATCLVFNTIDPQRGFDIYESLAKQGHVDSMVACGVILTEGLGGVGPREQEGMEWLVFAIALGSVQAMFELASVLYTGIDGVVDEDPKAAFELFERAAAEEHVAAMFMLADCLIEAEGCEQDVARAIPLLYKAADKGHRYARQRIRELLASKVMAQSMPP
jgi:TPR repeat protein